MSPKTPVGSKKSRASKTPQTPSADRELANEDSLPRNLYLESYRRVLLIRRFEETAEEISKKAEIAGPLHSSIGQESAIVGACMALRLEDYMVGTHRSHGHPIGKGANLKGLMAELLGKKTGVNQGKGGSMHLADFSVGSLGETSIVGSGMPVATGAALGSKMMKLDRVCLCFFGDGASNEGTFHESMNLAKVWQLPVIFFCENNGYGSTTAASEVLATPDIADRAKGYNIPSEILDGLDLIEVYSATVRAVRRAREGEGPTLLEAKTYRYRDHALNLGRKFFRPEDEIKKWTARDPLPLFRKTVLEAGFSEKELKAVESEVESTIEECLDFARSSPFPDPEEAYTHVFTNPIPIYR